MTLERHRLDQALTAAEAAFLGAGFRLPVDVLNVIESLRARPEGELDYHGFLREAFHESLALPIPWQESVRDRLPVDVRSAYIDGLAGRKAPGSGWLDPNYDCYLQLDRSAHRLLRQRFREAKAMEMAQHLPAVMTLCGDLDAALATVVRRLMKSMGLEKSSMASSAGVWAFEDKAGTAFGMTVTFPDVLSLRRDGWVIMQCTIPDLSTEVLGLNLFMLGAHEYADRNESPEAVAYSVYAQVQFFRCLQAGLRKAFPEVGRACDPS